MDVKQMAQGALSGPRAKLVDKVEGPIARHTPLSAGTVRAVFGALFLALAVRTVVRAVRSGARA